MGHSIFKADYPLMQRWLNRRGYRGSINDMFDKYFKTLLGGGTGTVNNLAHTYFGSLGYTGDTGERLNSFFTRVMGINNPIEAQRAFFASDSTGFDIGAPSFEADFSTGIFDKRITFSRTTNATRMKSDGLLGFDPHNLITYGEEFDTVAWGKTAVSVSANAITAPDGTLTADKITADGTSGAKSVVKSQVASDFGRTLSVYAKAGTNSFIQILTATDTSVYANFDLSTGTVGTYGSGASADITSVGDGWYRCSVISASTTAVSFFIALMTSSSDTRYQSNTLSTDVYLWGGQIEIGLSLNTYKQSGASAYYGPRLDYDASACVYTSNLLTYSEDLSNAIWIASSAKNYVANTNIAPDGTMTAGTLSDTSASFYQGTNQSVTVPDDSATYSTSVYVLKTTGGTSKTFGINLSIVGGTPIAVTYRVNTDTGYSPTATVEDVGLYWRVKGSITNNALGNTTLIFYLFPSTSDNGVYVDSAAAMGSAVLWGAQVQRSTSVLDYVKTIGFPQIQLDSTSPAPVARGLLMEEQRTNLILQSAALTTTWSNVSVAPTQNRISPTGSISAWTLTDSNAVGTSYITQQLTLTAETYIFSAYVGKTTGATTYPILEVYCATTTSVANVTIDTNNGIATAWTAYTGLTNVTISATCTGVNDSWWRVTMAFTGSANAHTFFLIPAGTSNATQSTGALDGTAIGSAAFWGVQVEAGAFATSYIPTTSASVTRGVETATISGTNFSSWFNPTAGTVVSNFVVPPLVPLTYPYVFRLGNASLTQRTQHWINGSGTARCFNYNAGSSVEISFGAVTSGQSVKTAVMYSSAGIRSSLNGGSIGSDAGVADYSLFTAIDIGGIPGSYILNSTISKLAYYPSAMTDAQLQNITT